jgi:predicted CoA-substrate-specific enzyme activase
MAARNLEVDIDDLGELHFANKKPPLAVNSTCAVFAESEIISLLAAGHGKEEIASGIHYSIARRIARLASRAGIDDAVLFDGGTALNKGMHAALEDELMRDIFIPEHPQITTAIGAALLAKQAVENK